MKNNKPKFSIKGYNDFFKPTDLNNKDSLKKESVANIAVENLVPFRTNPFKLYEGERFLAMVESIKTNGIIIPIIVRPLNTEIFEILSGHNRVEASKTVGLKTIPAIIREDLNDDEALLIVTETNLIQRSFTDLSHSERATALAVHHEAIKNQGKRTDLINEIENLLKNNKNPSHNAEFETSRPVGEKLTANKEIAEKYNLSSRSVSRYLRIDKLINALKERVDKEEIPVRAAVELSYISEQNQFDLSEILNMNPKFKVDIKKAEQLRECSENKKFNSNTVIDIFSGALIKNKTLDKVQPLKIKSKILSKYFKPEQKAEEIQAELIEALEFYRSHKS